MSQLEDNLVFQLKVAGFPPPDREYRFDTKRRWRFDLCFPTEKVAVEVEGGVWVNGRHNRGNGYEGDCEKASWAAIHGYRLIRVTGRMIEDGRALFLIEKALEAARCQASS